MALSIIPMLSFDAVVAGLVVEVLIFRTEMAVSFPVEEVSRARVASLIVLVLFFSAKMASSVVF